MDRKPTSPKAQKALQKQLLKELRDDTLYWRDLHGDAEAILERINRYASLISKIEEYEKLTEDKIYFGYNKTGFKQNINYYKKELLTQGIVLKQNADGSYSRKEDFWEKARKLPNKNEETLNKELFRRIEESGMTQRQLSEFSGVSQTHISGFLHDRIDPTLKREGSWTEMASRLSAALGCLPEDIFPDHWWRRQKNASYWHYTYGIYAQQSATFTHRAVDDSELAAKLGDAISTLTERERQVIILRYGLYGHTPLEHREISQIYNVTRFRIHQIEAQALRKLRHPTRSKKLRAFSSYFDIKITDANGNEVVLTTPDIVDYMSDITRPFLETKKPYQMVAE